MNAELIKKMESIGVEFFGSNTTGWCAGWESDTYGPDCVDKQAAAQSFANDLRARANKIEAVLKGEPL